MFWEKERVLLLVNYTSVFCGFFPVARVLSSPGRKAYGIHFANEEN